MGVHLLYKTLPSALPESRLFVPRYRSMPRFVRVRKSDLNFFCFFSFLSCLAATRPPARGRDPAQDTSRALPAARQTDTSHNSIQQSEQRLCFGIELPDADVLPSNPSRWRESSVESRAGWAFICCTRHSHPPYPKADCSYHDTDRCPDLSESERAI